jgi:Tol biopolymer transport system component
LFSSSADDLVSGDNGQLGLDVFLRDRASNTTVLVSANFNGTGGGDGSSISGTVSTNGRYVVFQSDSSDLISGDTNGVSDIFVRDLVAGTTTLVSVATNGSVGDGASSDPVMTPDGRYVVFISAATNLVVNDTNGILDIFVRDVVGNTTTLVSVSASGASSVMATPAITPDGRFVTFFSTAQGLVSGVPGTSRGEIYVRDLVGGTTILATTNATAIVTSAIQFSSVPVPSHPVISDDGRYVAFKSGWTNGTITPPAGTTATTVVMQYDSATQLTTVISTNGFPPWATGDDLFGPEMTPDGRYVAFVAREVAGALVNSSARLWDQQTGSNVFVSVALDGRTNSISHTAVVSPDGRFIAFVSNATNLVANVISNGFHVYLRDVQMGTTVLVDVNTNGVGSADNFGTIPGLSADGHWVAFSNPDGSLVNLDNNIAHDVFLRDVSSGTTELISQRGVSVVSYAADSISSASQFSLSDDGRWVAFASYADDLVSNDTNHSPDVFVHDLLTGTNILVSAGINGNPALGLYLVNPNPVLSRNGRFMVFVSAATNLVVGKTNGFANIFLRDLQSATTVLVSVNTNDTAAGNGDASVPVISEDGRYVAFLSKATNLKAGTTSAGPNTFLRDVNASTTISLSGNSSSPNAPSMSSDGRYIAYFTSSSQLRVWDTQVSTNIYTNTAIATSVAISPTGTRLLYTTGTNVIAADFAAKSNLISIPAFKLTIRNSLPWSTDGRFFAFVTGTNAVANDNNGTNDVYLCDLETKTLALVSVNFDHTGSANGKSDSPVMSSDGRFVAYRSFGTNIVAGYSNPPPNIFLFDRITGSNTILSLESPGLSWNSWNSRPAINSNGVVVLFQSWSSGLVSHDLNRVQDIFASAADSDGDGIPDFWMEYYFGHPIGRADDHSLAQDDADGDGTTNLQEFLAGTNPTDSASVFQTMISPMMTATNSAVLSWPSSPGKNYRVQYKDNLTDPAWLDVPGNVSFAGNRAYLIVPVDQPGRFYRVVKGD